MQESVKQFDIENDIDTAILHNGWYYFKTGNIRSNTTPSNEAIMYRPPTGLERVNNQLIYARTLAQIARKAFLDLKNRFVDEAIAATKPEGTLCTNPQVAYEQLKQLKQVYEERLEQYREVEQQYERLPEIQRQRSSERAIAAEKQRVNDYLQALRSIRV
ncbi:hypothetical protein Pan44_02580 [Caulifigura coniformis]|uniref:Uncharacterized protein n=1 Tax=Caulifigura coniformis TaxID=2527983 RepID=A0A517S800_9PLAN|nr:hypothetical protein [Caulifigura coniformis]QDT52249.1 hypothetical protein Pan44_02580 [Caulifigura coniformis]